MILVDYKGKPIGGEHTLSLWPSANVSAESPSCRKYEQASECRWLFDP